MANAKKQIIGRLIFVLFFLLFPYGQLLRIETSFFGVGISVHPIDIVALLATASVLLGNRTRSRLRIAFRYFWGIAFFSLLLSSHVYPYQEVLRGSLYLLRFISYYFFFELVTSIVLSAKTHEHERVFSWVFISLVITAFLGWIQYIWLFDLRSLKVLNWDDHLYRLTGTILDPGYMGILMVFGSLVSLVYFLCNKKIWSLVTMIFFTATMLFTYSRASYLSFVAGLIIIVYSSVQTHFHKLKLIALSSLAICGLLLLLPRTAGEGVKLERLYSISGRIENYKETFAIMRDSPVFGIGFNTLCSERIRRFDGVGFASHACSGSDSSMLFVFVTTGVVGGMVFLKLLAQIRKNVDYTMYGKMFLACSGSLLVHSFFLNSLFYPWVLGVMAIFLALSTKENR